MHRTEPEKKHVLARPRTAARHRAAGGTAAARLLRLAQVALVLALMTSAAPVLAATPKPDRAPVKSPPKTTRTYTPPARTYTPPVTTTRSPTQASKTSSHKSTKAKPKHKKKAKKKLTATTTTTATTTATTTTKPTTTVVNPEPAGGGGGSSGMRSAIAGMLGAMMVLLVGVGILLLFLAALDPYYLRPWRLRRTIENHRGDVAMGGLLLLVGLGIVYLISRSSGL